MMKMILVAVVFISRISVTVIEIVAIISASTFYSALRFSPPHTLTLTHTHTHTHTHMHIHTHTYTHRHMQSHTNTHTHNTHTFIHTDT